MLEFVETGRPGFGLRIVDASIPEQLTVEHLGSGTAHAMYHLQNELSVSCTLHFLKGGELDQIVSKSNTSSVLRRVTYTLDLGISVHRASYGQLTEGGPIPLPKSVNTLVVQDDMKAFMITNPFLNGHLEGCLVINNEIVRFDHLRDQTSQCAHLCLL